MEENHDHGHGHEHEQDEINKDPYHRLLETPFLETSAESIAKSKLHLRWKSKEEMGATTDDYSTITT
jgi:hypothetical protein